LAPEITQAPLTATQPTPLLPALQSAEIYPELAVTAHKRRAKPKRKTATTKHYYIQIAALAKSSPAPYLKKLRKRGFKNLHVKRARLHGRKIRYVVVGPYRSKTAAAKALRKVRKSYRDAFIRRF
jgi:cell division septation protein DedD